MIRVLLGQKGGLLRGALVAVLSAEPDMEVVAALETRDDVLVVARREQPDVVVLDWCGLDGDPGCGFCRKLCQALPGGGLLVVLDRQACAAASRVLARSAPQVGLIGTDASPADLIEAVRQLYQGRPVLDAQLAVAALTADDNPLTERERDVLRLAGHGAPAKEIAGTLHLSAGTVRNYLSRTLSKTGGRNRIEAVRIAQEAGWI